MATATRAKRERRGREKASPIVEGPKAWRSLVCGFGLVNLSGALKPVVSKKRNAAVGHFVCTGHETDDDGALIEHEATQVRRRWLCDFDCVDDGDGEGVAYLTDSECSRAFEHGSNKDLVVVPKAEIDDLKEEMERLEIDGFVSAAIDPIYLGDAYLFWPSPDSAHTYAILSAAMREMDVAAVGSVSLTGRTRQTVIRWSSEIGSLVLHPIHFNTEINWDYIARVREVIESLPGVKKGEVSQAKTLVKEMVAPFVADEVEDVSLVALKELIKRHATGGTAPKRKTKEKPPTPVGDVMDALKESIAKARAAKKAK